MAEYGDVIKQKIQDAIGNMCGVEMILLNDEFLKDNVKLRYRVAPFINRIEHARDLAFAKAAKMWADQNNIDILDITDKEVIDVIDKLKAVKPESNRYCGKCLENLRKTDNYCPNCGTRIDWDE